MATTGRWGQQSELGAQPGAGEEEISLRAALEFLRRQRVAIAPAVLGAVVITLAVLLLFPRSFTSTTSFTPQGRSTQSSIVGLASQFGVNIGGAEANRSPAFYADLLQSRAILGAVVDSTYLVREESRTASRSLADIFEIQGATAAIRREKAIVNLRSRLLIGVTQKTGVVNLAVTTRYDWLSHEIAKRLLRQIDVFNSDVRQTMVVTERRFTELRLSEVRQELRNAEDELQQFMASNRSMAESPQLNFREQRLQRDVTLLQGVYGTLAQAVEQAKIEEARDTPVITLIDSPELPARPDPRGTIRRLALAAIGGLLLGLLVGLLRERQDELRRRTI